MAVRQIKLLGDFCVSPNIDIINDKVWIQYDGTSQPVAEALLEAGILHKDIVLGFHPAELRQYTDFAVS
ncbi:element excision factor XisI family protein [Nostoc sp. LPT]|uniref:element excision factor XisI family protein n=1 Tax=Nostoc sp. LPT TaxID=2815387 RepID=UPI0025F396B5|nr:element excision factor XisI family protein [Nostoc sp. LPT]